MSPAGPEFGLVAVIAPANPRVVEFVGATSAPSRVTNDSFVPGACDVVWNALAVTGNIVAEAMS